MEQVLDKIAVEQFINALPEELRIWVASHSPETPTAVATLIEAYDSAHSSTGNRVKTRPPGLQTTVEVGFQGFETNQMEEGRSTKKRAGRDEVSSRDSLLYTSVIREDTWPEIALQRLCTYKKKRTTPVFL